MENKQLEKIKKNATLIKGGFFDGKQTYELDDLNEFVSKGGTMFYEVHNEQ